MHVALLLLALSLAILWRWWAGFSLKRSWHHSLSQFLLPPLVLLTTAISVMHMGTQGEMLGMPVGKVGYSLGVGFVGLAGLVLVQLIWQTWRSEQQIQRYASLTLYQTSVRLLDTTALFAAQIGVWHPQLVVSQGLLDTLTPEQVEAVLCHEQAHSYYRDTFWFFWLGWLRRLTHWLPYTDALWQELLLLRELRADRWAAQAVDPLLLAEALVLTVRSPLQEAPEHCVAFETDSSRSSLIYRLEARIDALLLPDAPTEAAPGYGLLVGWVGISLLPLCTLLLHS